MGLKSLYTAIETQLKTIVDGSGNAVFNHYHTWNSDLQQVKDGKEPLYRYPHCLIEIIVENIRQLGNGNQELECLCHLHIIHQKVHAGEEMEQNWDVFDVADITYQFMQKFKCMDTDQSVISTEFIRESQTQDFNHDKSIYHFIQTYRFTMIDNLMDEPVKRHIKYPPINVIINPPPIPTIDGDAATTTGTSETYTTESGMTNYVWTATGATIISGGTALDNTITASWATTGSKSISIDYTDTHGHNAVTPTTRIITVT
jgi:cell fate (sporulation/competence/biofilm development) regulator YlbF (YheA/YmcA/DUF963 family)